MNEHHDDLVVIRSFGIQLDKNRSESLVGKNFASAHDDLLFNAVDVNLYVVRELGRKLRDEFIHSKANCRLTELRNKAVALPINRIAKAIQ
jgi:hypothetical protein